MKLPSLARLFGAGRPARPARARLTLEALEDRLAPAVVVWDGAADATGQPTGDNLWSDGRNWVGDQVPRAGDTLVFGAYTPGTPGETRPGTTFNDFTNVPQFRAIYFQTP